MQVAIDKFGRVLIPKAIRTHLGLKPGSLVDIEEHDHEISLKLIQHKSLIEKKGSVMVFMGEAVGDIEDAIQTEREDRLKKYI